MSQDVAAGFDHQSVGDVAAVRRTQLRRHHGHRVLRDGAGDRRPLRNRDLVNETWPKSLIIESIISFGIGLVITLAFCFFAAELLQLNKKDLKRLFTYDIEIVVPKENIFDHGSDFDVQSLASHSWQAVRILERKNSQKLRIMLGGGVQVLVSRAQGPEQSTCPVCIYELADYFKNSLWQGERQLVNVVKFQITPSTTYTDSLRCIEKHLN